MVKIATSILGLSEEDYVHSLYNLEASKTDYFHVDVMDGKFVKNDTSKRMKEFANALSHITDLGMDVHLMVEDVEEYIDEYASFEPMSISFHIEAVQDKERVLNIIDDLKRNGIKVGIAINPETPVDAIKEYLPLIHMAVIMGVNPGEGGQTYIPETTAKIKELKKYLDENDLDIDIEVDGGINDITGKKAVDAGASILVSGAYILNSDDTKKYINNLKNL